MLFTIFLHVKMCTMTKDTNCCDVCCLSLNKINVQTQNGYRKESTKRKSHQHVEYNFLLIKLELEHFFNCAECP